MLLVVTGKLHLVVEMLLVFVLKKDVGISGTIKPSANRTIVLILRKVSARKGDVGTMLLRLIVLILLFIPI
jgi:hypothetical protein